MRMHQHGSAAARRLGSGFAKRLFDAVTAAILLLLISPALAIVAVAVRLEGRGSVLYRSRRAGLHGYEFDMLKFRKMAVDASGPPITTVDDSRFTRLGKFLSATKLDELPQLWNVIKGEMSLVGPRPEDLLFVAREPTSYETILQVRPGITGLSQLAFSRESELVPPENRVSYYIEHLVPAKIQLDQLYIVQRSFLMDVKILLWTLAVTILRRDVSVNRKTARLTFRRRDGSTARSRASSGAHKAEARET